MPRIIEAFTQFFDDAGDPLVNGKLRFVESGTNNTDKDTFADINESVPNPNPVILDGAGRAPNIFGTGTYSVILFTEDDVQIQQFDPVGGTNAEGSFSSWNALTVYGQGGNNIVTGSDGFYYRSLQNNNQNNTPASDSEFWERIDFNKIWNPNVSYALGASVYGSDGMLYFSLVASNLNNNPVTDTADTNWRAADQDRSADAGGTVDAITATFIPAVGALKDGLVLRLKASGANTVTAPTFSPNGLTARDIVKNGGQPLSAGDIAGDGHELILVYDLANTQWELLNPAVSSALSTGSLLHIEDQKPTNTQGGTFTSGAFRTRDLNTVLVNSIAGASISSNQVILPAGSYWVESSHPVFRVSRHGAKLRNITDGSDALIGSSEDAADTNNVGNRSFIAGLVTIASQKTFEFQHRCRTSQNNFGFGNSVDFGNPEVYSIVKIWKVA